MTQQSIINALGLNNPNANSEPNENDYIPIVQGYSYWLLRYQ